MGISVGKGSVEAALKELSLRARVKKRYQTTTDSDLDRPDAQNLLKRDFSTWKKHEIWLSDITYLPLYGGGFLYLCVVLDLATREILGRHVDDNMETALVTNALKNAIGAHGSLPIGTIFHSDQGSQYASRELRTILAIYGMKQSMSRRGQCWDDAPMERFFSSLKKEYEEALEFTVTLTMPDQVCLTTAKSSIVVRG